MTKKQLRLLPVVTPSGKPMALPIQASMLVRNPQLHPLRSKVSAGKTLLVPEMEKTPLPVVLRELGQLRQQSGATTTLKTSSNSNGNYQKALLVPISGNQKRAQVPEQFQMPTIR